jgi:integrase
MVSMVAVAEEFLKGRDVSRGYAGNVRRTARKLDAAGITPTNIEAERLNHWLSSMTCGSVTVASERRTALTLWKWAIDEGIIATPIRRVKKLVVRRKLVRAFDRGQCTKAVKFFSDESFVRENHVFQKSKCPVALWMEAWTRLCYETALRFGDAYNLQEEALVPGGIAVIASKTNQPVVRRVSARTSELLEKLASMSPDGTVFSWAVSRRWAFANIRRYFKMAGLDAGRSQWLRRSAATHAEMLEPGAGAKVLGHKTAGLAEKFYLDQSQLLQRMPSAPLLD